MKRFLKPFFVLLVLAASFSGAEAKRRPLPESWNGVWKGVTTVFWPTGKIEKVGMELEVRAISGSASKVWKITYVFGSDRRREVRNYEIRPVKENAGHFLIDEKNGFLIDNHLLVNTLYSQFSINGNLVTTRFDLLGKKIAVEMTMFDIRNPRVTKLTGGNFEVSAFKIKYLQKGVLQRL